MKNPYKYLLVWLSDHVVIFSSLKALIWFKSKNKSWLELFCLNELHYTTETPTTHGHSPLWTHTNPNPIITGEGKFPECQKIGHLGKPIFPECCTRGRIALREERLSWCRKVHGTQGREALAKGNLHLTATAATVTEPFGKKVSWVPCSGTWRR
jgi:hypothetical protein